MVLARRLARLEGKLNLDRAAEAGRAEAEEEGERFRERHLTRQGFA